MSFRDTLAAPQLHFGAFSVPHKPEVCLYTKTSQHAWVPSWTTAFCMCCELVNVIQGMNVFHLIALVMVGGCIVHCYGNYGALAPAMQVLLTQPVAALLYACSEQEELGYMTLWNLNLRQFAFHAQLWIFYRIILGCMPLSVLFFHIMYQIDTIHK